MSKIKKYTFLWSIENYSYCWHQNRESLQSPQFTFDELEGIPWFLSLYPRGTDALNSGCISITLNRSIGNGPESFNVNFSLDIVAADGSSFFYKTFIKKCLKETKFSRTLVSIHEIFSERKDEYLPNDILSVRCQMWIGAGSIIRVSPICARTRIGIEHISFHHSVENFSALEPNRKQILKIRSSLKKDIIASKVYITNGSCCDEKLMVEIKPSNNSRILLKCEISVRGAFGEKVKCATVDKRCDAAREEIKEIRLSLSKKEIIDNKIKYLPDDKLLLLCECSFSTGIEFERIEVPATDKTLVDTYFINKDASISTEKLAACPSIIDDLKDIYSNKFLTDVKLKTKTSSFPAHRIVLCARSPVFKTMMSNDMKEKNSDSIQVDDLEDDTVEQLLGFFYSDNIKTLQWDTATKLYYAADKYQIEKLKMICSSFLIDSVTTSTATELLVLADSHSDSYLKKAVENFILEHEDEIFRSEKWKELMSKNPPLALNTLYLKYNA